MKKPDNRKFCLTKRNTATGIALEIWKRVKTGWELIDTKHVYLGKQKCSRRTVK
jgi:hypothetical protein